MQRLEVSGAVRQLWWSLGVKGLIQVPQLQFKRKDRLGMGVCLL